MEPASLKRVFFTSEGFNVYVKLTAGIVSIKAVHRYIGKTYSQTIQHHTLSQVSEDFKDCASLFCTIQSEVSEAGAHINDDGELILRRKHSVFEEEFGKDLVIPLLPTNPNTSSTKKKDSHKKEKPLQSKRSGKDRPPSQEVNDQESHGDWN